MAKLRNVQFYRNTNPVACESHADARNNAMTTFTEQANSMLDGEMLLYSYTITGETGSPVHTITGVVRKNGNTTNVEIVANTDMFSNAAFTGKAEDVTYVNTVSGLAATNVQDAIDEVEGRVDDLEDELIALNGTAGIASVSSDIVTLKAGVIQTNGKIANSSDNDITLAKVAMTGEAEDVVKSSATTAVYDVTSGEISQTWINTVTGNAIAVGDSVDDDINKLDSKIAGLADEIIRDEQVINASVNSIKESVGLENDLTLSLNTATGIITNDTDVKTALVHLANAIGTGSSNVKDVAINGTTIVESNGVAGIMVDGTYNASTNKIATQSTVTTAISNLDGSATIASESDGVVTLKAGVSETDGVIANNSGSDIVLAKVATTGAAADVTYTYVNGVSGTVQAAGNSYENRIAALEALPTFETIVSSSAADTPTAAGGSLSASADTMHKIYLVNASTPATPNLYAEWITVHNNNAYTWEKIGDTETDLTGYVKTVTINGKSYAVDTDSTNVTLGTDYITNITTSGATYVNAVVGTAVKNTTNGTVTLPITINEKIQAVSTADSSNMGLAEASDVKSYVDTTIQGLDADITSDDAAVATVEVKEVDGKITDVVVSNISAGVVYNSTAGSLNLTANTATGAVTGADIAAIKGYVDAKAGAATLSEGNGIDITSNVVSVDLAVNSTSGTSSTPSSTTPNLLKIDSDGKLSISDTWDCGEY